MAKNKDSKYGKQDDKSYDDDGNIQDKRFLKAQTHPQFKKRKPKRDDNKNSHANNCEDKVDDRFSAIYTDSRFSLSGDVGLSSSGVDKYGRVKKTPMKKDGSIVESHVNGDDKPVASSISGDDASLDNDEESSHNHAKATNEDPESRIAYLTALSRGDVEISSSSDESSSGDEDDSDDERERESGSSDESSSASDDSIYGKVGILDPSYEGNALNEGDQTQITFEQSPFLAICNMDWSHVRAVDLFAIVSSFSSPGSVKRVVVYPSDFGIERMKKDNLYGPTHIWKTNKSSQDKNENGTNDVGVKGGDDTENTIFEQDNTQNEGDSEEDNGSNGSDSSTEDFTNHQALHEHQQPGESDFDTEKLRAYEASKLRYYFAVVEFKSCGAADGAYKELDGIEIGRSSATMDLRLIPLDDVDDAVKDREIRDECTIIPSKYNPPDFVVNALQQTTVRCTWEEGDLERDRLLTQYGVGQEKWNAMAEGDDLRAYLASDNSSDTDSSDAENGTGRENKGYNKRKLLGLDVSDEDNIINEGCNKETDDDDDSFFGGRSDDPLLADKDDDINQNENGAMQVKFIPGKSNLEDKIRSKLKEKSHGAEKEDLTPWEKYQLKRKEKRREHKRASRQSKQELKRSNRQGDNCENIGNAYDESKPKISETQSRIASSKEELSLLLAGDNDEENEKDYHMRSLLRREKNKDKKLYGSRKRKEDNRTADISGADFEVDTTDERFSALLEGKDARFGIDKTDPRYKETPAMRKILAEQTERRKAKKRIKTCVADENVDSMKGSGTHSLSAGATALSSLVRSLKAKVAKK